MLEVICGGMFAGKSELLIHRLKRASYANKRVTTNSNFVRYCKRRNKRFNVGDLVWYMLGYGPSRERVAIVTSIRDYSSGWLYNIKYICNSEETTVSSDSLVGVEARNLDKEND